MAKVKTKRESKELTGEAFDALPPEEKERIFQELSATPTEELLANSKPLTKKQRAEWNEWKRRRGGRPKIGQGAKMVMVTFEKGLLKEADAYAKAHKMKRSELVAQGLRAVMGKAS